jgi:hypothetical protein
MRHHHHVRCTLDFRHFVDSVESLGWLQ